MLFLLVSFLSFAQTSVWKATRGGNDIYLAGTIHLLKPSDFPLSDAYYNALQAADVLYVEADIEKLSDPAMAQKVMSAMTLTDGKTLKTILDEDVYKQLEEECATVQLPLANLNQFKPALAVVSLTAMKLMSMGLSAEGVDKHLMTKAELAEKPVKFMESVEFQINLLATMGEGNENNFVKHSLKDLVDFQVEFDEMMDDWRSGSGIIMSEQIEDTKRDYPKLYNSLLVERNNSWINKIDILMDNDETELIAVGTLHLHGDEGLINQLKSKGYEIIQLK